MRRLWLLLLVSVAGISGGCGQVSQRGVRAGVEQLASIAAEGALMADDVARGRTKTTFVRVHGAELSAQAEHESEKLNDDPVSPGLRHTIKAASELSSAIGGAIDDLRVSPHDREQAREAEAKLRHWSREARTLAEEL